MRNPADLGCIDLISWMKPRFEFFDLTGEALTYKRNWVHSIMFNLLDRRLSRCRVDRRGRHLGLPLAIEIMTCTVALFSCINSSEGAMICGTRTMTARYRTKIAMTEFQIVAQANRHHERWSIRATVIMENTMGLPIIRGNPIWISLFGGEPSKVKLLLQDVATDCIGVVVGGTRTEAVRASNTIQINDEERSKSDSIFSPLSNGALIRVNIGICVRNPGSPSRISRIGIGTLVVQSGKDGCGRIVVTKHGSMPGWMLDYIKSRL